MQYLVMIDIDLINEENILSGMVIVIATLEKLKEYRVDNVLGKAICI